MKHIPASTLLHLLELGKRFVNDPSEDNRAAYKKQLALVTSLETLPSPTYRRLFGVEDSVKQLQSRFGQKRGAIHRVQGLQGEGKTALINHVMRNRVAELEDVPDGIYWITLEHRGAAVWETTATANLNPRTLFRQIGREMNLPKLETLPDRIQQERVAEAIGDRRLFFVVDNFLSPGEAQSVAPLVANLASNTHFVFAIPPAPHSDSADYVLPPLDQAASADLLRFESDTAAWIQNAAPSELDTVYERVGGHPLALKLISGQFTATQSIDPVLKHLPSANTSTYDRYYQIYEHSWSLLSATEQAVLRTMTFGGPTGLSYALLVGMSGLSDGEVSSAIDGLRTKQLLYGSENTYTIHPLTYSFVNSLKAA